MIKAWLVDPKTDQAVKISSDGELIMAPIARSVFYNALAGTDNVAVELVEAKARKKFVITALTLYANKNVGVNDATVEIFHASSSGLNSGTNIFKQEMLKQTQIYLSGLNVEIPEGRWLSVVTDDDDIFANVAGYYVDA